MRFQSWTAVLVLLGGSLAAMAQEKSGPAADSEVKPLKVAAVAGLVSGEEKDFTPDRKDDLTFYLFVQADKFDRPIARFMKVLDQELAENHPKAQIIAVWLTDDVEKSKGYLPKAQESIKLTNTIWSVHPGDKTGPAEWSVDVGVTVTVVVAEKGKVSASTGYNSINDTVVPEVMKAVKGK